jgi:hypothetical protein
MLSGFKQFILRGNVVDMAVGVVIGAAFGGVVTALTADLLTPFIAAIVGKPDFSAIHYTINGTLVSRRPFHQRPGLVCADRRRRLFLRGHARECPGIAHAQSSRPSRSDHQEVPRMPERDSHRRPPLRPLRAASSGQSRLARVEGLA